MLLSMDQNGNNVSLGVGGKQPDADHIKMFVGQLPRSFSEDDVRKLFEEFGPIYQINMLRDKATGLSKGCCFITFFQRKAALDAQNALHNIRTLPGMHNPIQMKPADTENRSERKLFIGMISKKSTEDDIRKMFSAFGTIEECTILRDGNGHSRGCAFVTFTSRQNALNAIRVLHHSLTAEGCSSPMVVKLADTTREKEKDGKRPPAPLSSWQGTSLLNSLQQQSYLNLLQPTNNLYMQSLLGAPQVNPGLAGLGLNISQLSALLQNPALSSALGSLGGLGASGMSPTADPMTSTANLGNLVNLANGGVSLNAAALGGAGSLLQSQFQSMGSLNGANDNGLHAVSALLPLLRSSNSASSSPNAASPLSSLASYGNTLASSGGNGASALGGMSYEQLAASYASLGQIGKGSQISPLVNTGSGSGRQSEGPEGCNLFIYHLPPEYGDSELAQLFAGFGHIISAKVFVDKQTGMSKCFGFVSFSEPTGAQQAIQSMNGFAIGMKRLKVQLKRSRDKPY